MQRLGTQELLERARVYIARVTDYCIRKSVVMSDHKLCCVDALLQLIESTL